MKPPLFLFVIAIAPLCAQAPAKSGKAAPRPEATDWPMYNRDLAGTRYSPLVQVNTRNVARLTKAWSFRLNARASEATPIVVNDVMYLPAGNRVVAVEPETGNEIWSYMLPKGTPSRRGVAYCPGDQSNPPPSFSRRIAD